MSQETTLAKDKDQHFPTLTSRNFKLLNSKDHFRDFYLLKPSNPTVVSNNAPPVVNNNDIYLDDPTNFFEDDYYYMMMMKKKIVMKNNITMINIIISWI
ncbi:hypothetical protein H8356DRAFT_1430913 [Neocallimastix lanati (nom. inval.)]|nr:hypothetical protein H8356DRAFT_1430913 [Neocallimastix sp. JGI-2020a]